MKYAHEITIDLPLEETIKKMDNPENMKHWQRGLQEYQILKGKSGEEGAQMKLRYKMGKRELEMVETVERNNFPNEFHATYDAKNVHNIQKNFFSKTSDGKTLWRSESEFHMSGFMLKTMATLMPGMFKKQSYKYMQDFKNFAENGTSVANE